MTITYKVSTAFVIPANKAQEVGECLQALSETTGGITASDVLADATNPGSVLHPHFEWDNVKAAHLYREGQARDILRTITIVVKKDNGETCEMRGFHCVVELLSNSPTAQPERRYVSVERAKANPEFGAQIVQKAHDELRSWAERYDSYRSTFKKFDKTFSPVFDFVETHQPKTEKLDERMPWPKNYAKVTPEVALAKRS